MNSVCGFGSTPKILCTANKPQATDNIQHKIFFPRHKIIIGDSFKENNKLMCQQTQI